MTFAAMFDRGIDPSWVQPFVAALESCALKPSERVILLSEAHTRPQHVQLLCAALSQLGAEYFQLQVPTPIPERIPVRSTGSSVALANQHAAVEALAAADLVIDCTVEGLLHTPQLQLILASGARVFMVSNEHAEVLVRLPPDATLEPRIARGLHMLEHADEMHVTSDAGTDLRITVAGAQRRGGAGCVRTRGDVGYWPGGLIACFPRPGAVNGQVVLAPGDVNLTFKRYIESDVRLTVVEDFVVDIAGDGLDAALMRSYFAAWEERNAYAVSHVGWGMDPRARWDALAMYDKGDVNGTELRTFAGNFLYSTGANEFAERFTRGHFDLPMRACSIELDGVEIVRQGRLLAPLAPEPACDGS